MLNLLQHDSRSCQIGGLWGLVRCQQSQVVGICWRLNCLVTSYPAHPGPSRRGTPGWLTRVAGVMGTGGRSKPALISLSPGWGELWMWEVVAPPDDQCLS